MRDLVRRVLLSSGYTVLEAHDGREAVEVADRYPHEIDILVSDVVMPGMSGSQLAARLAETRPTMRCLFMSGYAEDALLGQEELEKRGPLLQKPFDAISVARKVREVLDAENGASA